MPISEIKEVRTTELLRKKKRSPINSKAEGKQRVAGDMKVLEKGPEFWRLSGGALGRWLAPARAILLMLDDKVVDKLFGFWQAHSCCAACTFEWPSTGCPSRFNSRVLILLMYASSTGVLSVLMVFIFNCSAGIWLCGTQRATQLNNSDDND